MKKRYLRVILTLALVMALAFSMSATASADGGIIITNDLTTQMTCEAGKYYTLSVSASYTPANADSPAITYQWYSQSGTVAQTSSPSIQFQAKSNDAIWCVASGSVNGVPVTASSSVCNVYVVSATPTPAPTPIPTVIPVPTATPAGVTTPVITKQPSSVSLASGQSTTLSVTATCANLGNGVQLAYQWFYSMNANGSGAKQISGANASTYVPPVYNSTVYYFVGVMATNGTQNSSIVYSNVVSVSYNGGQLKVTKNPTGETVDVGGSATFVARADNAASHVWRIVSKDTTKTVFAKDAPSYFSGLRVSGADTDTLVLSNIPASMNEWSVECKFVGADGKTSVFTTGAIIRVRGASSSNTSGSTTTNPTPTQKPSTTYTPGASASPSVTNKPNTGDTSNTVVTPTIVTQPAGATLSEGQTTTLSVGATGAGDSTELKYQWYRNDTNSNANGTAIGGAQSATYVPDTISGSKYYYVGVWSTDGTHTSKVIYSSPVEVTYTSPVASPSPSPEADKSSSVGSAIIGPVIAMVLAAAAIGVGVFFLLKNVGGKSKGSEKRASQYYDDYDDAGDDGAGDDGGDYDDRRGNYRK